MLATSAPGTVPFNPLDHPILFTEPRWMAVSSWREHVPFALLAVDLLRPERIVELGSHYGVSLCAFCQAVEYFHLHTKCYAVDTWQGDPQAGFYGEEVLATLRAHHDPLYGHFSTLLQGLFDNAVGKFEDGSIDLLHIDGLHTYEAVKHDFETWLPKMSRRGVVLFHDTAVEDPDFGVKAFWAELTARHPGFEFHHGSGLGVLAVGPDQPPALECLTQASPSEADMIRRLFAQLGSSISAQDDLKNLRENLSQEAAKSAALHEEVHLLKQRVEFLDNTLNYMRTSVFWKMRDKWVRFKGAAPLSR